MRLSPKGWYLATLAATGDKVEANEAHNREFKRRLDAKEKIGEVM